MCTGTRIKDVYQGVQGACPWQAVTSAEGTAEHQQCRAVGTGLKLVSIQQGDDTATFYHISKCIATCYYIIAATNTTRPRGLRSINPHIESHRWGVGVLY